MKLSNIIPDDCQNIVLLLIAIIVVIIVYFIHVYNPKKNQKESDTKKKVKFSESEEDSNAIIMYGKDSCPWCKRQKTELGEYWSKVKYINCQNDSKSCQENEIEALPTWVIKGERSEGFMKKDEFEKKCGF